MMTILILLWMFVGALAIGLCRIKPPTDTRDGRESPEVAFLAWSLMLGCWPMTVWNRKKFVRYGEPGADRNPSWLVDAE